MFGNLRGWEWVILLLIVLLLFGARKLPDLARSVGKSLKIFRSEVKDLRADEPAPGVEPAETDPATDGEPKQS
jgi:twin arginine-targeting protein translocase, TatA/E family